MKPITNFCLCSIFEALILVNMVTTLQSESSDDLIISFKENYRKLSSEFDLLMKFSQNITSVLNDDKVSKDIGSFETDGVDNIINESINKDQDTSIQFQFKEIKLLADQANRSIINIQNYHQTFISEFEEFEELLKKKNLKKVKSTYQKNVLIYNSISLLMLCLLSGGLVGVIFILYYSFKSKEGNSNEI